jgi:hypothetical protein
MALGKRAGGLHRRKNKEGKAPFLKKKEACHRRKNKEGEARISQRAAQEGYVCAGDEGRVQQGTCKAPKAACLAGS